MSDSTHSPLPYMGLTTAAVSMGSTTLSFVQQHAIVQDLAVFIGLIAGTFSIAASVITLILKLREYRNR